MKKVQFYVCLCLMMSVIFASCDNDDGLEDTHEDITLLVSETTVREPGGSVSASEVECMQIKEANSQEWKLIPMGSISGFDYERGHSYELEVHKTTLANPPADGLNVTYSLIRVVSDVVPSTSEQPEKVPDEAKFKLKLGQVMTFMGQYDFDSEPPLPAPFDKLIFQIVDYYDDYAYFGFPKFLDYYDSIVVSSPVMPDTYCVYKSTKTESGMSKSFESQWSSYFYETYNFTICLKGYKDNEVKYEYKLRIMMRQRDFIGIDWDKCGVALLNPKTETIYNILDTRYEFLLTDTQETNKTAYVIINLARTSDITEEEYPERQKEGLRWMLRKYLGDKTYQSKADFKTLPEDVEVVETYENNTTRTALLYSPGDDTHQEKYYVIAEAKKSYGS